MATTMSTTEAHALVVAAIDAMNARDLDRLDDLVAADYVRHCQATPEVVVKADLNVLEAKTAVSMTFRRNTDRILPASHVVEIKFDRPRDAPNGEISKLHGLLVKQDGKIHGVPLEGEAAKVTSGYFMVALSSGAQQLQRNLKLLKENPSFEVVIDYTNGHKALLVIEKGASGEQAFKEAFAAWGQ